MSEIIRRFRFRRNVLPLLALSAFVAFFAIVVRAQQKPTNPPPGPGVRTDPDHFLGPSAGKEVYTDFRATFTGDSILATRALRPHENNPRFMQVVNAVRRGDARFTNLEGTFPLSPNAYPGGAGRGQWHISEPWVLKELQWMGFNLFSLANNHSLDFGVQGALDTIQLMKQEGAVHAGTGANLGLARAPGFLSTANGEVALVATASTFPPDSPAGAVRADAPGRPGLSPLRSRTTYRVDAATVETLRKIQQTLGIGGGESNPSRTTLGTATFEASATPAVVTTADPRDVTELTRQIRDAHYWAPYVVASIHAHEGTGPNALETPAQFLVEYAHKAVDAGAEVFVGHGPHVLRGIEIYKGKPIFYSLGNFIYQTQLYRPEPTDYYERFGLGIEALNSESYNARSNFYTRDQEAAPVYWSTAVAEVAFHEGRPTVVTLTPVSSGYGLSAANQGIPEVPDLAEATRILEHLQKLSEPFGTKIAISNGLGKITIPAAVSSNP